MLKNIREAIEATKISSETREFIQEKLFEEYKPTSQELKQMIDKQIESMGLDVEMFQEMIYDRIDRAVDRKLDMIADQLGSKLKERLISLLGEL